MSDSFDDQKRALESVLLENKTLKKETADLKKRLQMLEGRVDAFENKERTKNLIVAGVPKQTNLDIKGSIMKIFTAMQIQTTNMVMESFRLDKNGEGPILLKMQSEQAKRDVIKRIKDLKGISTRQCGLEGSDRKIYFNEDLPMSKRVLFKMARELKKQKGYKAAFYLNGSVYIKTNENEQAIKIKCESDLDKLR
ncbi:unnamed protein product [Acanthoscelides obtectus]|uniref:FP protein C-terminal domain-containing protein n=1 Tax=Acanthoscelides obtectus TaxID=200917 RepID=A0A9P0LCM4_ACAOB|nr:unnamed protein product [Acanthoscelides obtectus]CAK1658430.1 hypothetical protein AOBTE_LOCUS20882 [Acanthoscelides obtectus]